MQNSDMVDYRATKATPRIQRALALRPEQNLDLVSGP
jgi:hypothetical protein